MCLSGKIAKTKKPQLSFAPQNTRTFYGRCYFYTAVNLCEPMWMNFHSQSESWCIGINENTWRYLTNKTAIRCYCRQQAGKREKYILCAAFNG
jgi:hypothetical protein